VCVCVLGLQVHNGYGAVGSAGHEEAQIQVAREQGIPILARSLSAVHPREVRAVIV